MAFFGGGSELLSSSSDWLCRAGILFLYYYSIKITGAAASTYSLVQADPTGIQVVVADPTGKTDFTGWTVIQTKVRQNSRFVFWLRLPYKKKSTQKSVFHR